MKDASRDRGGGGVVASIAIASWCYVPGFRTLRDRTTDALQNGDVFASQAEGLGDKDVVCCRMMIGPMQSIAANLFRSGRIELFDPEVAAVSPGCGPIVIWRPFSAAQTRERGLEFFERIEREADVVRRESLRTLRLESGQLPTGLQNRGMWLGAGSVTLTVLVLVVCLIIFSV
jgi:hypothetical protein